MTHNTKNTALMVFSLSAQKESERKRLLGRHHKAQTGELFNLLISETQRMAQSAGVDVHWVDEKKQKGSSFGERFKNAFQDLFNLGYENVVSIGNDCPDLTSSIIRDAIAKLQQEKLVLGPATDGGVYLIGLNKRFFKPAYFEALPWQKENLFKEMSFWAAKNDIALDCLETFSDIDDQKSLLSCIKANGILLQFLVYCFQKIRFNYISVVSLSSSFFYKNLFSLRAPPHCT